MGFQKEMTRCGAPLYVYSMPHATSVAVGVHVNVGSRDEKPHESGIAHALEHMVFQGNERHPDQLAIASEIEEIGAELNAYTGQEFTFYYRFVQDDRLQMAVNSIASQLTSSYFRQDDISKEMKNVVQEICGYSDNPVHLCRGEFHSFLFRDHPIGNSVLGTEESVSRFRQSDFISFHDRFYHPKNYSFIVIGKTTTAHALRAFDNAFANHGQRRINDRTPRPLAPKPNSMYIGRDVEQANVMLGTLIPRASTTEYTALQFYSTMIGGGISFPLFQEVRNKRGLCYHVSAETEKFSECSVFQVYIGCNPARVEEAIKSIRDVINDSCTEHNFERARSKLIGSFKILNLGSSPQRLMHIATKDISILGSPRDPSEMLSQIERIRFSDVQDVVGRFIAKGPYAHVCVGPEIENKKGKIPPK